jgi:hypothetical protein
MIAYLAEFDIIVPPSQFEQLVEKMMNEEVMNAQLGQPNMMIIIAAGIIQLAGNLITAAGNSTVENYQTEPEQMKDIITDADPAS